MADLRGMGAKRAVGALKTPTRRQVFLRAAEIYQQRFGQGDCQIPASFEIVTVTGGHRMKASKNRFGRAPRRIGWQRFLKLMKKTLKLGHKSQ